MNELTGMTDAKLLLITGENPDAFTEIVRRHQAVVFATAFRITRNSYLAEDITQEAFLRAFRNAATYRGEGAVAGWICQIARNLALNTVTRSRERPSEAVPERTVHAAVDDGLLRAEAREAVRVSIERLPDPLRQVILLREYDELTYEEIAEHLDLPLNTVRTRLHRSRTLLGRTLAAQRS